MPIHEDEELIGKFNQFSFNYFHNNGAFDQNLFEKLRSSSTPTWMGSIPWRMQWCQFHAFFVLPNIYEYLEATDLAKKIAILWPNKEEIESLFDSEFSPIEMEHLKKQLDFLNIFTNLQNQSGMDDLIPARTFIVSIYRLLYLSQSPLQLAKKLAHFINPKDESSIIKMMSSYIKSALQTPFLSQSSSGDHVTVFQNMVSNFITHSSDDLENLTLALQLSSWFSLKYNISGDDDQTLHNLSLCLFKTLYKKDNTPILPHLENHGMWQTEDLERFFIPLSVSETLAKTPFTLDDIYFPYVSNNIMTTIQIVHENNPLSNQQWLTCVYALCWSIKNYKLSEYLQKEMPIYYFCILLENLSLKRAQCRPYLIEFFIKKIEHLSSEDEVAFLKSDGQKLLIKHLLQAVVKLDHLVHACNSRPENYQEIKSAFVQHYNQLFFTEDLDAWNRYQVVVYDKQAVIDRTQEILSLGDFVQHHVQPSAEKLEYSKAWSRYTLENRSSVCNDVKEENSLPRMLLPKSIGHKKIGNLIESAITSLTEDTSSVSKMGQPYLTVKAFIQDAADRLLALGGRNPTHLKQPLGITLVRNEYQQALIVAMLLDHPLHTSFLKPLIDECFHIVKNNKLYIEDFYDPQIEDKLRSHEQEFQYNILSIRPPTPESEVDEHKHDKGRGTGAARGSTDFFSNRRNSSSELPKNSSDNDSPTISVRKIPIPHPDNGNYTEIANSDLFGDPPANKPKPN